MTNTKKYKGGDDKGGEDGKGSEGRKDGDGAGSQNMCTISSPTFNIITLNNADSLITIDFGQRINNGTISSNNKCLILSLAYAADVDPCELLTRRRPPSGKI